MTDVDSDETLSRLAILCSPPYRPDLAGATESGFGAVPVPTSHVRLIVTYGTGCFDEFLWVFAVGAPNAHLDIVERTRLMRAAFRGKVLHDLAHVPDDYRIVPDELVQWGGTDNADILAWVPKGEPDDWPTVIIQTGQLKAVFSSGSSTATVLGLLDGSLRVPFFPSDFPDIRPEFSANPYA